MTTLSTLDERRNTINQRLETALGSSDDHSVVLANSAINSCSDRWYGQLVALSYATIADQPITDVVLSASAATELLRGYCQLRSELLYQLHTSQRNSLTRDPVKMLLAGDYLNSTAYTVFFEAGNQQFEKALEALIETSRSLIDSFNATRIKSFDTYTFLDKLVGILGEGAVTIAANLTGSNTVLRNEFTNLGRALSSAYHAFNILELEDRRSVGPIDHSQYEESDLCQYGARHFRGAMYTLNELQEVVDVEPLLELIDAHFGGKMGYKKWI